MNRRQNQLRKARPHRGSVERFQIMECDHLPDTWIQLERTLVCSNTPIKSFLVGIFFFFFFFTLNYADAKHKCCFKYTFGLT